MSNIKIAIFASGNGTNAEAIAKYFEKKDGVEITMIISNKKDAFVLERAKKMNIPAFVFSAKDFQNPEKVFKLLQDNKIDFIILAGFLVRCYRFQYVLQPIMRTPCIYQKFIFTNSKNKFVIKVI